MKDLAVLSLSLSLCLSFIHFTLSTNCTCVGPDKFSECLALIKEHSLYTNALAIYTTHTSDEYKVSSHFSVCIILLLMHICIGCDIR